MTEWSEYVKRYAKRHKLTYREASMDEKCKEGYQRKKKRMSPRRMSPRRMSPRRMSPRRMSPRRMSPRRMNMNGGGGGAYVPPWKRRQLEAEARGGEARGAGGGGRFEAGGGGGGGGVAPGRPGRGTREAEAAQARGNQNLLTLGRGIPPELKELLTCWNVNCGWIEIKQKHTGETEFLLHAGWFSEDEARAHVARGARDSLKKTKDSVHHLHVFDRDGEWVFLPKVTLKTGIPEGLVNPEDITRYEEVIFVREETEIPYVSFTSIREFMRQYNVFRGGLEITLAQLTRGPPSVLEDEAGHIMRIKEATAYLMTRLGGYAEDYTPEGFGTGGVPDKPGSVVWAFDQEAKQRLTVQLITDRYSLADSVCSSNQMNIKAARDIVTETRTRHRYKDEERDSVFEKLVAGWGSRARRALSQEDQRLFERHIRYINSTTYQTFQVLRVIQSLINIMIKNLGEARLKRHLNMLNDLLTQEIRKAETGHFVAQGPRYNCNMIIELIANCLEQSALIQLSDKLRRNLGASWTNPEVNQVQTNVVEQFRGLALRFGLVDSSQGSAGEVGGGGPPPRSRQSAGNTGLRRGGGLQRRVDPPPRSGQSADNTGLRRGGGLQRRVDPPPQSGQSWRNTGSNRGRGGGRGRGAW